MGKAYKPQLKALGISADGKGLSQPKIKSSLKSPKVAQAQAAQASQQAPAPGDGRSHLELQNQIFA